MSNQIFYDPERKRWKRLRRIMDVLAILSFVVIIGFAFSVVHRQKLPDLSLPATRHNYKAVLRPQEQRAKALKELRRKTDRKPSDITLNTGEGLRAAYFVEDDPSSYSSLREHISQIDLLFPEWLHIDALSGGVLATTLDGRSYPVLDSTGAHDPDSQGRVKRVIHDAKEDTETRYTLECFPFLFVLGGACFYPRGNHATWLQRRPLNPS